MSADLIRIGLIDGRPNKMEPYCRIIEDEHTEYLWDSEMFGVPEFRRHADQMIKILHSENPFALIMVCPFYPKFKSVQKNMALLALCVEAALDGSCDLICICLEAQEAKTRTKDLENAYRRAFEAGIPICISAGNQRPFQNPLIHWKFTIPVLGLDNKYPSAAIRERTKQCESLAIGILGNAKRGDLIRRDGFHCSKATAQFTGMLSKLMMNSTKQGHTGFMDHLLHGATEMGHGNVRILNVPAQT